MRLIKDSDRWVAESSFEERAVPKAAGFRWDAGAKRWWTDRPERAARLLAYADGDVAAELRGFLESAKLSAVASRAVDAAVEVPAPAGMSYLPFQRAGVAYMMARPNTLVGDQMGLGKTIEALGFVNATGAARVLVICPASLKLNWLREAQAWLCDRRTVVVVSAKGSTVYERGRKGFDVARWVEIRANAPTLHVVNFDVLHKYEPELRAKRWDVVIVDECHYLKSQGANRTQHVVGRDAIPEKPAKGKTPYRPAKPAVAPIPADRMLWMSGTPIVNRPIEAWTALAALDGARWNSWFRYVTRYCAGYKGKYGWDTSGASNLEELQQILRESIMLRRLKSEVLTELPAKQRQVIELPANGATVAIEAEQRAYRLQEVNLAELRAAVELAKASPDPEEYNAAVMKLRAGASAAFAEISKLRHATALAKLPYVLAHLDDAAESSGKVVVMAHHKDVVAAIAEHFGPRAVSLTGDTAMLDRQVNVDRFQRDPKVEVFIGSITAAGVGITLTAASHVVFAELDWVPGNLSQAEDRCHRIGQAESVLVQHLVLEGSLDARMAHVVVAKQEVIDRALDREPELADEPVLPIGPTEAATAGTSRRRVDLEAAKLDPAIVPLVHEALRVIAGLCDGARLLDGHGFNKLDARIGQSLAASPSLSLAQAVLGLKLARKYRRQLDATLVAALGVGPAQGEMPL